MRRILLLVVALGFVLGPGVSAFAAEEHPKDEATADKGEKPHDDHGNGEGEADGISLVPSADLALWSVVVFLVLLFVLRASAWGPIVNGLDARESRIRTDIAQAEADRAKAAQLLAEHEQRLKSVEEEIRGLRAEARSQAEQMKQDAVAAGKEEAAALVEKAKGDIEQSQRQAADELQRQIAEKIVFAAEKLIGRKMNDGDEQRLADEALVQFAEAVN